MKRTNRLGFAVLLLLALTGPAQAQPGFGGIWSLEFSAQLPGANPPCLFEGGGELIVNGSQVTGQVAVALVSGPSECPAAMAAEVMGTIDGDTLFGMLDGGNLGGVNFQATVSDDGNGLAGTFSVKPGGPFSDLDDGTFTGARQLSFLDIPTLRTWGLVLLASLLALVGLAFLYRTG